MSTHRKSHNLCASFQAAMDVLAKPWNGLLLASLADRALRFSELAERVGSIGDRILSLRLKELEEKGLVDRRVIAGPPVRVEYELTETGRGFIEVQASLGKWGEAILKAEGRARKKAG